MTTLPLTFRFSFTFPEAHSRLLERYVSEEEKHWKVPACHLKNKTFASNMTPPPKKKNNSSM